MRNTIIKILCLCFLVSFSAYAANMGKFCSNLEITIRNNTENTCVLLYKDVISGQLLHKKDLMQIPSKSESGAVLESDGEAELRLTYACGTGMTTINMVKKSCLDYMNYPELKRLLLGVGRGGLVFEKEKPLGSIVSMADMDVSYDVIPGILGFLATPSRYYNEPGFIFWTFF